jgi:hypothetical protein
MITPNDALQFIKDHHNGEIPYTFGKNEYARWMAEFANHTVTKHLHKLGVGGPASASVKEGEQLGNESGAKSVRVDECDHNPIESPIGYYCSKCHKFL